MERMLLFGAQQCGVLLCALLIVILSRSRSLQYLVQINGVGSFVGCRCRGRGRSLFSGAGLGEGGGAEKIWKFRENFANVTTCNCLDIVHCYQVFRVAVKPGNADQNGSAGFSVEDLSEEGYNNFGANFHWLGGDIKHDLFPTSCNREVERLLLTARKSVHCFWSSYRVAAFLKEFNDLSLNCYTRYQLAVGEYLPLSSMAPRHSF